MHRRNNDSSRSNGTLPISAVISMQRRRRYIGGLGTFTSCVDGDCQALEVLEAVQDLIAREGPQARIRMDPPARPSARFEVFRETQEDDGKKKKRRRSKYQVEFGKQLKVLKRKHPRTAITKLMSRAHTLTRKKMGMKRRRK